MMKELRVKKHNNVQDVKSNIILKEDYKRNYEIIKVLNLLVNYGEKTINIDSFIDAKCKIIHQ
jgi:hypothetical protein